MDIRVYDDRDEAQVVALWRQSLPYDAPHNEPVLSIRNKVAFQPELFFVADVEGQIVGTVMAGYDGHRGWLYSVAVRPDFRRQGVGRALVQRAEEALAALGCVKVNLQILASNASVGAFYESLGYQVEPRISMGKRLV